MYDERTRVALSTLAGAAIGGVLGFLYLTEGGRRLRQEFEPRMDDFIREMRQVRASVEKARLAADEGLKSINELTSPRRPASGWGDRAPGSRVAS